MIVADCILQTYISWIIIAFNLRRERRFYLAERSRSLPLLRHSNFCRMATKDAEAEQKEQILDWIGEVIGEKLDRKEPFEKVLKDGVILCKLINKMVPGHVKKINTKGGNFALMENLAAFQKGMRAYGVPEDELFQPVDLFEARNVKAVVKSLAALARIALNKGFAGPAFGPKMSTENKREFSEDLLREGRDGHIGLQAGFNKGATQAGINMGKPRSVYD